jgi:cytoskeletal protein RodZ
MEISVQYTMKNTFLITAAVAALVVGANLATAQTEHRDMPAAPSAAPEQKAPGGTKDQPKANAPQKSESLKPAPTAQGPDKAKPSPTAQAPDKAKPATTAQAPDKDKPATTGQAQDKSGSPKTQSDGQGTAPGQSSKENKPGTAQAPTHNAAPGAAAEGSKPGASVTLSNEQHVRIRDTLRGEKAEHLKNVQFAVTIGEAVPRTVHLYKLPVRIVEYVPEYRDYEYILVGDEILIVDPRTFRIVAVIPA